MANSPYINPAAKGPPPTLERARNRRQKTRACGLSPNHWYAAELSAAVKPGEVTEVVFWRRSIALYRGEDGEVRAIENRCAHRQLKLSTGQVRGARLTCQYHGWGYDGTGDVVDIPHETFGHDCPKFSVASFAVRERYGVIWIFPGARALAEEVPMPALPELDATDAWPCVPIDFLWHAHHSMVIDNVSDYTHGWLHRKYEPFRDPKLTGHETVGDKVTVRYDTKIGAGKILNLFIPRKEMASNKIELAYDYPYHTSNTDDFIKHFISVLPIDERTSRVFFLFYYKRLKLPLLPMFVPKGLMVPLIKAGNTLLVKPLLQQDGDALALEQEGYDAAWDAPLAELNPIVKAFQELTIRKWEEYLAQESERPRAVRRSDASASAARP